MSDAPLTNPSPQFGTAEYSGGAGNDHCQYCHQPVAGTYYRVNNALACPACAEEARAHLSRDTHAAFMRALFFGIGAAILGMILYALFTIATGLIVGYVSLGVGWLVGKAMMKGSGGVGGRRYQITAALLTYAAVSMAAVPIAIHYSMEHRQERRQASSKQQASGDRNDSQPSAGQSSDDQSGQREEKSDPKNAPRSRAQVWASLALYGIASPFYELWAGGVSFSWLIGIVILVVGIRIAWRMTAGVPLQVDGPFADSKPAS